VLQNLTLITGGARSGKSTFAEKLAQQANGRVIYIATMSVAPDDRESDMRIQMHRQRRPDSWTTVEEARLLEQAILRSRYSMDICLIDCLSLWLSNVLPYIDQSAPSVDLAGIESQVLREARSVLQAISQCTETQFIVVTNEVGSGIVPNNVLARAYRDVLGTLNQEMAQRARDVWFCCVGLQLKLK
jgi:adenosylcobinamide kinase / adenosylcobinamide-phosphate guanylyltransferase